MTPTTVPLQPGYYRVPGEVDLQVSDRSVSGIALAELRRVSRVIAPCRYRQIAIVSQNPLVGQIVWENAEAVAALLADPDGCWDRYEAETGRCAGCGLDVANYPDNQRPELHVNCVRPSLSQGGGGRA